MKLVKAGAKILFSRVGQVLANAAVVMFVAQTLGPVGQGHYSLTVAMVMLLASLLGGGMGLAAVPPLRQHKIRPTKMVAAQLTWAVSMLGVFALLAWLANGDQWSPALAERLGWSPGLAYLAAVAAAGMMGFEIFSYDLLARGRLVVGAAVNGIRATGHLAVVAAIYFAGILTFSNAVGAFALAQCLGMVIMLIVLIREIRRPAMEVLPSKAVAEPALVGVRTEEDVPDDLDQRSLFGIIRYNLRHGWLGQISAVAYFLLLRLDQGLLEYYRGAAEVGIYSVAVYVGEMLWLLPGALTPLLVHSSAAHASDPERDRTAARAVRLGILVTLAAGIPVLLLADPMLKFLAGGAFAGSGAALKALLPGIVILAPATVLAGDFIGRGKPHWNTQASALTVVANVAVGVILIPRYGAVGAAWSSSIAYTVGTIVMLARFRQVTRMSLRGMLLGKHRNMVK